MPTPNGAHFGRKRVAVSGSSPARLPLERVSTWRIDSHPRAAHCHSLESSSAWIPRRPTHLHTGLRFVERPDRGCTDT